MDNGEGSPLAKKAGESMRFDGYFNKCRIEQSATGATL
jgi:hypothetical protein